MKKLFKTISDNYDICLTNARDTKLIEKIDKEGYEWLKKELGVEIEKERQVVLGTCATKEALKAK